MLKGTILVRTASNYGTKAIYPACGVALLLAEVAGTKTITEAALRKLIATGIEVRQQWTHGITALIKSPADLVY